MTTRIYTIGHSTRSGPELIALLEEHAIEQVVDVRRYPGSRRHPQFGQAALAGALRQAGIEYRHAPELGGRRKGRPDSVNTAWRNAAFRAYADHVATEEFSTAFERLLTEAARHRTAILCAEALPHRCHRRLIADVFVAHQNEVLHIVGPRRVEPHALHPNARLLPSGLLVYPGPDADATPLLDDESSRQG